MPTQPDWMDAIEHEARALVAWVDIGGEARSFFDGSISAERYAANLVQIYHYVRWSTSLLEQAGQGLKRLGRHPHLAELLLKKAGEENGHERWLLADLANLGWTRDQVESIPPCAAVTAYLAWNRFTGDSGSPAAFLGTAYVLEYLSVHRAEVAMENLIARGTIPNIRKAVTFLRGHAGEDVDHVAELAKVLRSLTDPEEQEALILSARTTRVFFQGIFSTPEVPVRNGE